MSDTSGDSGVRMRYQRSMEIEQRLDAVLELIRSGSYSTPALAEKLGVSVPTISRSVEALRERGYNIQAIRGARGWRYTIISEGDSTDSSIDRLEQP
ncbi:MULTISPECIES: HTH domain-containing protein [Gimesia]|nr:HTH domain-containing protein [Gimesia maris]